VDPEVDGNALRSRGVALPAAQVEADSDRDRWFSAPEAKEYGIVDHVIVKQGEIGPQ